MKDTMKDNKGEIRSGIITAVAVNLGAVVLRLVWMIIPGVPILGSTQAMAIVASVAAVSLAITRNKYTSCNLIVVVTCVITTWLMDLLAN